MGDVVCFHYGGSTHIFNYWVIIKITKVYIYFGITSPAIRHFVRHTWSRLTNDANTVSMFELYTDVFRD